MKRGNDYTYGFIAQEVLNLEEVNVCVEKTNNCIPNVYCEVRYNKKELIIPDNVSMDLFENAKWVKLIKMDIDDNMI